MLKRFIIITLAVFGLATFLTVGSPAAVLAGTPQDEVCQGIGAATGSGCQTSISLRTVIRNIINIFSVIIGVVAVVMIMVAGFRYVTAAGDSGNVTSAKNTLIYAIVGLVIAGLSQAIVRFVLESVN